MNWKCFGFGVIICLLITVTLWRWRDRHQLQEQAQQTLKTILENMPEHVKFIIEINRNVVDRLESVGFEGLTPAERAFFSALMLNSEVNNGGFDQYYFNPSAEYAVEAVAALEKIGATKTADIVRHANSLFKSDSPPKDRVARQKELDALPEFAKETLNHLDDEFYECDEDIDKLLYDFVVENRSEFLEP